MIWSKILGNRCREDLSREVQEAKRETLSTREQLEETKMNTPYIEQLVEELDDMRKRNHFGQSIRLAYRGESR